MATKIQSNKTQQWAPPRCSELGYVLQERQKKFVLTKDIAVAFRCKIILRAALLFYRRAESRWPVSPSLGLTSTIGNGMGGFLLADVWLVYSLYKLKPVSVYDFILSVLVILFVTYISKNPKMHLGHYKKPMYGYGFILALTVSNSIGCYLLYGSRGYFWLSVGMVLYFVSDFLLMFQYFYKTEHRDKLKLAKMYTYFIGAYLIAYSIGV